MLHGFGVVLNVERPSSHHKVCCKKLEIDNFDAYKSCLEENNHYTFQDQKKYDQCYTST